MAINVLNDVWKCRDIEEPAEMLVMLAIADCCDPRGWGFPSVRLIADKARQSERNVQRVITRLVERGLLIVERKVGRGNPSKYRVTCGQKDVEKMVSQGHLFSASAKGKGATKRAGGSVSEAGTGKGDVGSLFEVGNGDNGDSEKVTNRAGKGDTVSPPPYVQLTVRPLTKKRPGPASPSESDSEIDISEVDPELVERLAVLVESHPDSRFKGSTTRRRMIAQRCALDSAKWVTDQLEWICGTDDTWGRKMHRDLSRFEDGVRPGKGDKDGDSDRLRNAEKHRAQLQRRDRRTQGEDYVGVG